MLTHYFVKVDAQIVEDRWRTISYMKRYSYPKLYCKKLSNQKPTANTVSTTRRTTLIATTSFPSRKFSAVSSSILLNEDILTQLPFWFVSVHSYGGPVCATIFIPCYLTPGLYPQTCQWSVHSCKIDQSATQFLGWWGGVYYERVHRSSFLVLS